MKQILDVLVEVETGKIGPAARVAYEDLWIPLLKGLAQEIMNGTMLQVGSGAEGKEDIYMMSRWVI